MRRSLLPIEQLTAWSTLNGANLFNAAIAPKIVGRDGIDHGAGLVATRSVRSEDATDREFLSVPADLILSKERVEQLSKTDPFLREVLAAVGELAQKPRIAIIICLLVQITHSSPDLVDARIGLANPFTDYVKFLPKTYSLPSFYEAEELELLSGTSLADAIQQKLASLEREFVTLKETTEGISWCRDYWWNEDSGYLTLDDWKVVDAMYRSRALELPGIGDAMVPLVDMANHASDDAHNARFEIDAEGNVLLLLRETKDVKKGEEITIQYGVGGACEMVFSYGFIERTASSAREMFLSLDIPLDDPLRVAKKAIARQAPGVRLFMDNSGQIGWESKYIWWACTNEEDGLEFEVAQKTDGTNELHALWKGTAFDPASLEDILLSDELRDIYRLRAVVTMQHRLEEQGRRMGGSEETLQLNHNALTTQAAAFQTIRQLHFLEGQLLSRAYEALEKEKDRLVTQPAVVRYLGWTRQGDREDGQPEDDFS